MSLEPLDADGLVIPTATPSDAWSAVMGLRSVSAGAREVSRQLAGAPTVATAWAGSAEAGYRQRRAVLSTRVADIADVAEQAATVIRGWLSDADAAIAAMRAASDQVEAARAGEAAANAAGRYGTPDVNRASHAAWAAWAKAKRSYWDGVDATAARLGGLRAGLTDHPLDATEQIDGFFAGAVDQAGAGLGSAWGLTGEVLIDPGRWWQNVTSVAGGVTGAVEHPIRTVEDTVDLDGWQHGRYGEAAAVVAAAVVPGPKVLGGAASRAGARTVRRGGSADRGARRFASRMADAAMPRPRLQTLDEMIESGVDLEAHEHVDYGHAIRRHVATGDGYLRDRLKNGTLLDDGSRGSVPTRASSFTDLETANDYATRTIQAHEAELRDFCAHGASGEPFAIRGRFDHPLGDVLRPVGDRFTVVPGHQIVVVAKLTPDRRLYIETAYVDP